MIISNQNTPLDGGVFFYSHSKSQSLGVSIKNDVSFIFQLHVALVIAIEHLKLVVPTE